MCVVSVVGFSADTCDAWEYSFPFFLLLLFQPQGNSLAYLRLLRLFFHECHKLLFSKIQVQAKTDGFNPENVHEWEPHQLGQPGDPHAGSAVLLSCPTAPCIAAWGSLLVGLPWPAVCCLLWGSPVLDASILRGSVTVCSRHPARGNKQKSISVGWALSWVPGHQMCCMFKNSSKRRKLVLCPSSTYVI